MAIPGPEIFTPLAQYYFPEPYASLFMGLILGVPLKSVKSFSADLKTVGLTHLVVLSGSNITLLITVIQSFTSKFSKQISIMLTILSIGLFIIFIRPQAPIIRAAFMSILTLVANITGRRSYSLYLLGISLILTACIWPHWITTVSLQLSYAASLGLILFGSAKGKNRKPSSHTKNVLFDYLADEFRITIAAQIFTAPIIWYTFRTVSFIAPLSNVLVSWTIPPIMLAGIAALVLGSIHPIFGLIPSYICFGFMTVIIIVTRFLAQIPFASVYIP